MLDHRIYACADFAGLAEIVADFLAAPGRRNVRDAAIGCAGMRHGDLVVGTNLAWPVSLPELRALGIPRVAIVNDFVAVAHAVQCMDAGHSALLRGFRDEAIPGPTLVIGPGTGLGAAIRVPHGDDALVLPSEAGQLAFAPGNAREIAVLEEMLARSPYVSNEQIVSGPGLRKLYASLCAIDGIAARQDTPAQVVEAARGGGDVQAIEAVGMFCSVLGSVLGDQVMACGATRVYVAGGLAPRIRDFLEASDFRARFLNKGMMRPILERVPVRLMDHPHKGVIGAAAWYLQRPSDD
jgi:glucokinase